MPELSCEEKVLKLRLLFENHNEAMEKREQMRQAGERLHPIPDDYWIRFHDQAMFILDGEYK